MIIGLRDDLKDVDLLRLVVEKKDEIRKRERELFDSATTQSREEKIREYGSDRDLTLSFLKGRPYGEYWLEAAKLHDKGDHLQSWRAFTELPQPVIISIGHIPIEYRHERTTIRSIVSVTHAEQHARIPEEEAKGDITVPMYFVMPISLESMASTLPQLPGGISESLEGPVRGLLEMRREYMRCGRATYTATGDYAYSLESLRKEYQPKVRGEFHPRLKEVLASSG